MDTDREGGRAAVSWEGFRSGSQTRKDFIGLMSKENLKDNEDSFTDTYSCLGKSTKVPE